MLHQLTRTETYHRLRFWLLQDSAKFDIAIERKFDLPNNHEIPDWFGLKHFVFTLNLGPSDARGTGRINARKNS